MKKIVVPWPNGIGVDLPPPPRRIKRPCDYGLDLAIINLEIQLGSVEAYNRLVTAALLLKSKVDEGNGQAQNICYAIDPKGDTDPYGNKPSKGKGKL